ncbi:uncharacterized protein [Labrus bergylta]|uniref:uncharacterized protein isoform X1 n=1 Tax=Labrus bergylta TaxID=56723 RepID=UPI0033135447
MSVICQKGWKKALTSILEELDPTQYTKFMEHLDKIPRSKKTDDFTVKMPGIIIEHYGLEESVYVIDEAINDIPRKDPRVQDLLRPFVDKLGEQHDEENKGTKRKHDEVDEEKEPAADPLISRQPEKQRKARPWEITIHDVKSKDPLLETQAFSGKVVQKSGLRTYHTEDKKRKFFSYLAVADDTDCVKMMVYGKEHYRKNKEGRSYLFRSLIKDHNFVKVIQSSKVSLTKSVEVPEELEVKASKLIYPESPFFSIAYVKTLSDKMYVSVEGTIEEIDPAEDTKVSYQKQKIKTQRLKLTDESSSIWIQMWGEETKQCKGLSVGDVVKLTNMKTNEYYGEVKLNSTANTKIQKVKTAGIQSVKIEIVGILKATKKETRLEADFNQQVHTFVVASKLLAKELDIKLECDFEERLLDKIPLIADVEIEGSRIKKINAALKM